MKVVVLTLQECPLKASVTDYPALRHQLWDINCGRLDGPAVTNQIRCGPIHRSVLIRPDGGVHPECDQQAWTETHPAIVPRSTPGPSGAHTAGFTQVADAMLALGLI